MDLLKKFPRIHFYDRSPFWKKAFAILVLGFGCFFARHALCEVYMRSIPYIHPGYKADKAQVLTYFDDAFYRREYAAELKETNLEPIDHFMQRSGRLGGGDYDPNNWFNVTLYKERLWPCSGNAFVDFLHQPLLKIKSDAQSVEIFATEKEFYRAWIAVEGFMRMNKYRVVLVLGNGFKDNIPLRFKPMVDRGLSIRFSGDPHLSFYKSPFLKNPDAYGITPLPVENSAPQNQMITRFRRFEGYEYLMHRLYNYTHWKKNGIINPCMLNFAHFCWEPIEFSAYGRTEPEFKKNMQRLAPGFDLMLLNSDIDTPNLRIVPGIIYSSVGEDEIPKKKVYKISFLLSLGGKGMKSFKTRGSFIYHFRKLIWDNEDRFSLPTRFYLSRRDMDRYPASLHHRLIPDLSKKWIYGSQFTIAMENSRQNYYFSEKLFSCFIGLSVPIYIGCPNISKYFDIRGMFIANDPEDVIRIANTLTPQTYEKMLPYLLENKKRAEKLFTIEADYIDGFYQDYLS